jgi:Pyruvate/2-oxoacid:ferredoxin oxidoreductase delta subunit
VSPWILVSRNDKAGYESDGSVKENVYERTRLDECLEMKKQFWKLGRPKFGVNQSIMCKDCQDYNYEFGNDRFEVDYEKERVNMTQSLCKKCVLLNIDITNRHLHHADSHYPDNYYKKTDKKWIYIIYHF